MPTPAHESTDNPVLVFGEVLFDVFPDGKSVLGGASFNVAWNLQGLGLAPLLISRIGEDELGLKVIEGMKAWDMTTAGVQRDSELPTGVVQVSLRDGQPAYDIVPDQAYDFIDAGEAVEVLGRRLPRILYHGTLAARAPVSRETLDTLSNGPHPRFVDINLRAPWWHVKDVQRAIEGAHTVKLSDEELNEIGGNESSSQDLSSAARALLSRHHCGCIVVTRGADGALVVTSENDTFEATPPAVDHLEDAVGAGDAFSAVTILGHCRGWDVQLTLRRAVEFAATICTIRGATTMDREFYTAWVERWNDEGAH